MNENNNLELWNNVKSVPPNAQKKITGGRLKGMTDISPQWRYLRLTELFGPCGFGWYYEITKQWVENGADGVICAFVNIDLHIKNGDEWSKAIPGTGGSNLVSKESLGLYTSDEAFKMATTDALSVAMKVIGVGADIYFGGRDSKYFTTKEDKTTIEPQKDEDNAEFYKQKAFEEDKRNLLRQMKASETHEHIDDILHQYSDVIEQLDADKFKEAEKKERARIEKNRDKEQ